MVPVAARIAAGPRRAGDLARRGPTGRPRARLAGAGALTALTLLSPAPTLAQRPLEVAAPPAHETPADLAALRTNLSHLLADPAIARAHVGLIIQAAGSGEVLFRQNAERRFTAASTTKLVTGAVALSRLGPNHTWRTRIAAAGPLTGGTLEGDLWLVGGGDPRLTRETLARWARVVRAAGIRRIRGDLVGDDRVFDPLAWGRGWMWDDLPGAWAAGVSALQVSPARIPGELRPGPRPGDAADLRIEEAATRLPIRNAVLTGTPGSDVDLRFRPPPEGGDMVLEGWIPADAERVPMSFAPPHPTVYFLDLFVRALAEEGIELEGRARRAGGGERAEGVSWERTFESRPLAEALTRLLKVSDNQVAETLLRTLGVEEEGEGSSEAGLRVVRETLASWGIEPDAVSLADGSGLSRYSEITPAALVRLLRRTSQLPGFRIFRDALPVAGVDGTLSRRFVATAASENVQAKTGSLAGVRGLAGFVEDGDGESLIFALILNGYDAPGAVATALEDLLIEQLALYHGPTYPEGRARPRR